MYNRKNFLVYGFHGCDKTIRDEFINNPNRDCKIIETLCFSHKKIGIEYDSARAVFFEGNEIYPSAGFKQKNHIQIAVRNPNCIKGYFIPRENNESFAFV